MATFNGATASTIVTASVPTSVNIISNLGSKTGQGVTVAP
jgi:hypothetical protein